MAAKHSRKCRNGGKSSIQKLKIYLCRRSSPIFSSNVQVVSSGEAVDETSMVLVAAAGMMKLTRLGKKMNKRSTNLSNCAQEWWEGEDLLLCNRSLQENPPKAQQWRIRTLFIALPKKCLELGLRANFRAPENRGCVPRHVAPIQHVPKTAILRPASRPDKQSVPANRSAPRGGLIRALPRRQLVQSHATMSPALGLCARVDPYPHYNAPKNRVLGS